MDKSSIWKISDESRMNDYTLIIPSVAVGNVGQLACDLLISSLNMQYIGSVYSPAQIPVLGHDPYNLNSSNLSTSCEIYKSQSKKICVLQLRSPLVYKYAKTFLEEIVKTFIEKNIKDIIILTSSFAHEQKQILSTPFRYIMSKNSFYTSKLQVANLMKHESNNGEVEIFGGGFASVLYKICIGKDLPCLILYKYCSEGDNIPDAYDMLNYLTNFISICNEDDVLSELKQPASWTLLFGRPPPSDIY